MISIISQFIYKRINFIEIIVNNVGGMCIVSSDCTAGNCYDGNCTGNLWC